MSTLAKYTTYPTFLQNTPEAVKEVYHFLDNAKDIPNRDNRLKYLKQCKEGLNRKYMPLFIKQLHD